jgi:TPR repeat protein
MKILPAAFILLAFCSCLFGQKQNVTNCELQELAISAALGDVIAQHDLGVSFFRKEDYSKAAVMWRLASSGGDLSSFNNLGYLTYYGKGAKADHAEGVRLWRVAAEKGFAESQIHLAYAYLDGRHLKQDFLEAYAWAKAGRHFAAQTKDKELRKSLLQMAEQSLTRSRNNLSEAHIAEAEKKAAEYVTKFVQK